MKKRFLKKLKSRAGETLVETLFAILIATFASVLLASSAATAIELNQQARTRDKVNQQCLEKLSVETDVQVTSNATLKIQPMQMDTTTGKLVKKTDGDSIAMAQSVHVDYTGCQIEDYGFGDYSTYKLHVTAVES